MTGTSSPMRGRLTSGYDLNRRLTIGGRRIASPHAGIDIAPPTPGTVGTAVYAFAPGIIGRLVRTRQPGQPASVGVTLAPGRSGNGALIVRQDRGANLYGHVRALDALGVGDRVRAGQLIGYTDASGTITGPHLHFEDWSDATDHTSHRDPLPLLRAAGISPGDPPREDWLDMATKQELQDLINDAIAAAIPRIAREVWTFRLKPDEREGIPREDASTRLLRIRNHAQDASRAIRAGEAGVQPDGTITSLIKDIDKKVSN